MNSTSFIEEKAKPSEQIKIIEEQGQAKGLMTKVVEGSKFWLNEIRDKSGVCDPEQRKKIKKNIERDLGVELNVD